MGSVAKLNLVLVHAPIYVPSLVDEAHEFSTGTVFYDEVDVLFSRLQSGEITIANLFANGDTAISVSLVISRLEDLDFVLQVLKLLAEDIVVALLAIWCRLSWRLGVEVQGS